MYELIANNLRNMCELSLFLHSHSLPISNIQSFPFFLSYKEKISYS